MNKYDMCICHCGKIHMIPWEKIDKAIENEKEFCYICADCGQATIIGADKESDWNGKIIYSMYSRNLSLYENMTISSETFEEHSEYTAISEIYYSHGIKVPMMSGMNATHYKFGIFSDDWYPDFYKIEGADIIEVWNFINKWRKDRATVNMNLFIHDTPDEYLKEISCYLISQFDWTGTKYERK